MVPEVGHGRRGTSLGEVGWVEVVVIGGREVRGAVRVPITRWREVKDPRMSTGRIVRPAAAATKVFGLAGVLYRLTLIVEDPAVRVTVGAAIGVTRVLRLIGGGRGTFLPRDHIDFQRRVVMGAHRSLSVYRNGI